MKEVDTKAVDIIKNILVYYLPTFGIILFLLLLNQFILLMGQFFMLNHVNLLQIIRLLLLSSTTIIVNSAVLAVIFGFLLGLIKIEYKLKQIGNILFVKKIIIPVFILSLIIAFVVAVLNDFILSKTYSIFINQYNTILMNEVYIEPTGINSRNMNSIEILQEINKANIEKQDGYRNLIKTYKLELHYKSTKPIAVLVLSFFAISLSIIINSRKSIGFLVGIISIIMYLILLYLFRLSPMINDRQYSEIMLWLPNIIYLIVALFIILIYKMHRPRPCGRLT